MGTFRLRSGILGRLGTARPGPTQRLWAVPVLYGCVTAKSRVGGWSRSVETTVDPGLSPRSKDHAVLIHPHTDLNRHLVAGLTSGPCFSPGTF